MLGVFTNCIAIIIGGILGLLFKRLVTPKASQFIEWALGYCTLAIGIKMVLKFENVLVMIGCVVAGGLIGQAIQVEKRVEGLARSIEKRMKGRGGEKFVTGFSTASIIFCTGAMAVVGGIQAGISQDYEIYFAKSLLDGVFSISFAAVYGVGVIFSSISILIYQGAITLAAPLLNDLTQPKIVAEITGVGGVLALMIGTTLSGIKKIPVGDFLPAIPLVIVFCLATAKWLYVN